MADRSVTVRLEADISSYIAGMTRASAATGLLQGATASLMTGQGALAVIAGGAVVGGFAAAVNAAATFEQSMSGVQAATMASAGTMSQLRDAALQAGADTAYSASEAADAITEMAKAGVSAKDIMGGGLTGALNLAAAGQLDVADAAEIAATALSVFGLSGAQMPHVADLLAAGAGKAQGSVEDLSQALNQSALVAKNTGLSIEDTTGALALFASNGLLGSDAGTSFKTMLMSLNPRSEEAATLMDQLGLRAYDAQGQFVGLQAYAGQLQDGLRGLSEEQRNAALQTIFGTDAIRAATILYQSGSDGVATWTRNVNDAGFAARQAAIMQDNLRGDLEKLGGAWDSLMIALGSGSQGPLRDMVQGLTSTIGVGGEVLAWFLELPGPVHAASAAMVALYLASGPLSGVLIAVGSGLAGIAGRALGTVSSLAAARIAFGSLVGTVASGAILLGAGLAIGKIVTDIHLMATAGDDARQAIDDIAESLDGLDNGARFDATNAAIDQMREKLEAAQAIIDNRDNQSVLYFTFVGQFTGPSAAEYRDASDAVDEYTASIDQMEAANARAEAGVDAMTAKYGMSREQVLAFADAHNIDLSGSLSNTEAQFARYAGVMSETEQVQAGLTQETAKYTDQVSAARSAIDEYVAGLSLLNGDHLTAMEAERQWAAALMDAQTALQGLDGSVLGADGNLNLYSESGNQAAATLRGLRESADQVIGTMIAQGGSAADAAAKDAQLRDSFFQTALQMTGSREAAERLTNQIYGLPAERQTQINVEIGAASSAVTEIQGRIDGLRGRVVNIEVRSTRVGDFNGVASGTGRMGTFWTGGYTGAGNKYEVAGLVHRNELVVPSDDVDAIGLDRLRSGIGAMLRNPDAPQPYPAMPREMGWLPAMASSSTSTTSNSTNLNVVAGAGADEIARKIISTQRDEQFLRARR